MSKYADIIALLEKAEGPTRGLDILVENATDTATFKREPDTIYGDADHVRADVKPLTSSLDAAIGLVERMLPKAWLLMSRTAMGWYVNIDGVIGGNTRPHGTAESPMLMIALLLAMFRALEAMEATHEKA